MFAFLVAAALTLGNQTSAWKHASVSAYAVNMETGEVLLNERGDATLTPASCMKAITTAAALQTLGPETRFQTTLEYDGTIDVAGVLQGNLYIHGGGDPCLGSNRIASSLPWEKQIMVWADAVQKLGIKKIVGKVIGDDTRWEKARAAPTWYWEDLGNYYGAGASALTFHENAYTLFFRPGKVVGDPTLVLRTEPPLPRLEMHNEVKTGPVGSGDRACIYGSEFSDIQYVRGTVPAGVEEFSIRGAIPDTAVFCSDTLTAALEKRGVVVKNQWLPPSKREIFHTTTSPTVQEIVNVTNQVSHNLFAEHLLKKIGEVTKGEGSTKAGTEAVTEFLRAQGLDLSGFHMADGSGLSRSNLVTSKQLVSFLVAMRKSPVFPEFFASLRVEKPHVKAKSGSMSLTALVIGYAGYAGNVAFAILVNQCVDRTVGKEVTRFLNELDQLAMEEESGKVESRIGIDKKVLEHHPHR